MRIWLSLFAICSITLVQCKSDSRNKQADNQIDTIEANVDEEIIEMEIIEEEIDSLNADIDSLLFLIEEY